jgi:GT2 family glycosyltransferase
VAFFDDDVDFDPPVLGFVEAAYRDSTVAGVTGQVIEPKSHRVGGREHPLRRWLPGGGRDGTFTRYGYPRYILDTDRPADVEFMPGCFLTARRDVARQVRFDEAMTGYAVAEDEDFSYRLSRLGGIRYVPRAALVHRKMGYSSQDSRRFSCMVVVNRAYLFRKNFPQTPVARAQFGLLVLMLFLHRLANRDWRGARGVLDGAMEVFGPSR